MTDYGPYKVHPLLDAFPLLEGTEFDELVEDIRQNGLGHPIILTHDKSTIVDGRNRYRACEAALVDPLFRELLSNYTEAQIADFIISENLRRRHLNPGQVAFLALEVEKHYAELAKQRRIDAAKRDRTLPSDVEVVADRPPAPKSQVSGSMVPTDLSQPKHVRESAELAEAKRTLRGVPKS